MSDIKTEMWFVLPCCKCGTETNVGSAREFVESRERRIRRASRIETLEELLNVAVQHGYDDASVKSPLYARIRSLLSSARSEAG